MLSPRVALTVLVAIVLFAPVLPVVPASGGSCGPSGPANDCRGSAIEWFGKPETFSNVGATIEAGEPTACDGQTVSSSVWFSVEVVSPGSSNQMGVIADAPFYATIALYEKNAGGALVLIDCSTSWYDEGLHSPTAWAPCTPGKIYWIQVGGLGSAQGAFQLEEYQRWNHDECWFKPTRPTEPRVTSVTGGNARVSLSWVEPWWDGGRSVELSHYNVYRSSSCAGPWTLVGSPTARSFSNTGLSPGTTYCFIVTAVNPVGEGPSEPGRTATTWPLPRPPTGLAVEPEGDGGLELMWQASPDQGGVAAFVEHRVYRATSASGPFNFVGSAGATATAFVDSGLGRGTTWHYQVSAVSVVGEGAKSAGASGTTYRIPGQPVDVTVRHVVGTSPLNFEVKWSPPSDPAPFTHYKVYRATSPSGTAQYVGQVASTTTKFVDGGRGALIDYHYEVRAWNPAGEGLPSARACIVYPFETFLANCD